MADDRPIIREPVTSSGGERPIIGGSELGGYADRPLIGLSQPRAEDENLGWGQSFGTFLGQLADTATALPSIAVAATTDPIGFGKDVVRGTAETASAYGPFFRGYANLLSGDIEDYKKFRAEFNRRFYKDPLGVGGMAAIVGPGAATRISALSKATPTTSGVTRAAVLGWEPKGTPRRHISVGLGADIPGVGVKGTQIVTRTLPRHVGRAQRALVVDRLLKAKVAPHRPLIGEYKRAARALRKKGRVPYLQLMSLPVFADLDKTWRSMSKPEKVAVRMTNLFPLRKDLNEYVQQMKDTGTPESRQMAALLEDPRYGKLYDEPTDKMREYNRLGHEVDQERQKVLIATGAAVPDESGVVPEFVASPYRHTRIIRGAKTLTDSLAYKYLRKTDATMREIEKGKKRMLRDAERFGTNDIREITRQGRIASNELIRETGFRGRVHAGTERVITPEGEYAMRLPESLDLEDLGRHVDEAYDEAELYRDNLDKVMRGEFDTNLLDELDITPQGGWPSGRVAMAEAMVDVVRKQETSELRRLQEQLKRAQERRLTSREMDEMGIKRSTDLRQPTAAEIQQAVELRIEVDRIQQRLKQRKRYRLTEAEVTRLTQKVDDLSAKARRLESVTPIRRSPSYMEKRMQSRYTRAERILEKEIKAQENALTKLYDELPVQKDPSEMWRIRGMQALEPKYRRAVQRYERLLTAEHAVRESHAKSAEIVERMTGQRRELGEARERRIKYIAGQRERMRDLLQHKQETLALRDAIEQSRGQLIGGGDPSLLRAEIEGEGRMVPFYAPDEMIDLSRPKRFAAAEGSITPPRPRADIHESRALLMRRGLIDLGRNEPLGPAYFRSAKHMLNHTLHGQAIKMSTKIRRGESPPPGWEFLRQTTGETIGTIEKLKGSHMMAVAREFEREHDLTTADANDPDIDFDDGDGKKYRRIVPKAFADEFRAERYASNNFVKKLIEKPMDVWRTLLLHLRIPWLVNNILGNSFMYAVRFWGVGGMAKLLQMYASDARTVGAVPAMKRFLSHNLNEDDMRDLFVEQIRGTHFETQATGELPEAIRRRVPKSVEENRLTVLGMKTGQHAVTALPRIDKKFERNLRRRATNRILRGSEEVQQAYRTLRAQGQDPSFRQAVDKALEGDPNFRDFVVTEVNQGLGDFLSLSSIERHWIRQTVPFYAWMREISRVSGRLLVDHPARVLVLQQMAQAAAEIRAEEIPKYMRGAILNEKAGWVGAIANAFPGGGGSDDLTGALALHGASPYGTVPDLASGLRSLVGGNKYERREFLGNLNPLIGAGVEAYTRPESDSSRGLVADFLEEFGRSVPQSQVLFPYTSYLYPERTRWDLLSRLGGDPRVRYDPEEALYQLEQGR